MLYPLLVKELRIRARGREIYTIGSVFVLVLSILVFGLLWEASTGESALNADYGEKIFLVFIVVLMLAISLSCPAFNVGAISSERERLTFDQLRATLLKPHQIFVGEAASTLIYVLILLFASLPLAILIMPLGGVSPAETASCYLVVLVSALAFSLVGLMCSAICKSTRASTVMTYSIIGLLLFGTTIVPMILTEIFQLSVNRSLSNLFMALNPFYAAFSVLGKGGHLQMVGLSLWIIVIIGYLIVSVIASGIALLHFKRMMS